MTNTAEKLLERANKLLAYRDALEDGGEKELAKRVIDRYLELEEIAKMLGVNIEFNPMDGKAHLA